MRINLTQIRKPVKRVGAEKYILLNLVSFAGSVTLTRLFLYLTGYPQVGSGEIHIAHVLWGGLLLYIAGLCPLLYANRWVYTVSGIVSGIGIGLFIDEVGKFITQTNNYFYPPAAPIIYAFFLLSVLLYNRIKAKKSRDIRSELYAILDGLEEVLDRDLSDVERSALIKRLDGISGQTSANDLSDLAGSIQKFITKTDLNIVPHHPGFTERMILRYQSWENSWLSKRIYQTILAGSSLAVSIWILSSPILTYLQTRLPGGLSPLIIEMVDDGLIHGYMTLNWFEARIALETAVGLVLLAGSIFVFCGKEKPGINLLYLGIILSLTTVNLIVFYFDQFSTIVNATVQFAILVAIINYRNRFLTAEDVDKDAG